MKKLIFSCILFFATIILSFSQEFPVKEALQSYVSRGDIAGVVTIIATKDQVLQTDSLGDCNLETQTPIHFSGSLPSRNRLRLLR
jgi:hypothetical protein